MLIYKSPTYANSKTAAFFFSRAKAAELDRRCSIYQPRGLIGKNIHFARKNSNSPLGRAVLGLFLTQVKFSRFFSRDTKFSDFNAAGYGSKAYFADGRKPASRVKGVRSPLFKLVRPGVPAPRLIRGHFCRGDVPLVGGLKFGYRHERNRNAVFRRLMLAKYENVNAHGLGVPRFKRDVLVPYGRKDKSQIRLPPLIRQCKRARFYGRERSAGLLKVRSSDWLYSAALDHKGGYKRRVRQSWYSARLFTEIVTKLVKNQPFGDVIGPDADERDSLIFVKGGDTAAIPDYQLARGFAVGRDSLGNTIHSITSLSLKVSYRRSRLDGSFLRFMKLVPFGSIPARKLAAASKMLRRGSIRAL